MADTFKLPVSSYDELVKIIRAYGIGKIGVSVSLDELVKSSGISKFVLSKNNGFLIQIGLITKGNKKSPTETCRKLASAYSMDIKDEISAIWKKIFNTDDFIAKMLSFVSVKGRVSRDELINHIVYSADCGNSVAYKTGAAAIVEIMKITEMISENNGYITLSDGKAANVVRLEEESRDAEQSYNEVGQLPVATSEKKNEEETTFFIQQYTCESGEIAKFVIPEGATEDDLLGFRDMLNIALKRKFKIITE